MKRLATATIVCVTLLGGVYSLRAEAGEGSSAGERNVWTLSDGYLRKGDWKIKASWDSNNKILRIEKDGMEGSGILDWDDLILKEGENEIEDLGVQVGFQGLASASITEFHCNKMQDCGSWGFKGNTTLKRVRASGPMLTVINGECFSGCASLEEVKFDFPNLRTIYDNAFSGCTSLKANVADILNSSVTTIDSMAFYNVKGLAGELTLTNVQSLGGSTFKETGLTKLYLAGPLASIPEAAFYNDDCAGITNATFDLAENATVQASAFRGGRGAPFEQIPRSIVDDEHAGLRQKADRPQGVPDSRLAQPMVRGGASGERLVAAGDERRRLVGRRARGEAPGLPGLHRGEDVRLAD